MISSPYFDEKQHISSIQNIRNEDYALIRMTPTMINKNNIDANGIFRDLLSFWGLVDYESMQNGSEHGVVYPALFIEDGQVEKVNLKFYRVNNSRGDRRFSIETIKRKMLDHKINVNDLLYISIFRMPDGSPKIYFVNLTNNTPTKGEFISAVGVDAITELFEKVKPRLEEIIHGGFVNNSKGPGPIAPKDVGDTLESLLGIKTNNRNDADINGLIEVKSKGGSRTLDTLFTLRPHFEGTRVAAYEPDDRKRVSAFARIYGYDSDKHPGFQSLYITIGSNYHPKNHHGFYLDVDDNSGRVNLMKTNAGNNRREVTAFWTFDELKKTLYAKHPSTLWVKADVRNHNGMAQFKYTEIEFSRAPQFTTFLTLVKEGIITYDWRGYVTKSGKYSGKNHGNAWRINPDARTLLFGNVEHVDGGDG